MIATVAAPLISATAVTVAASEITDGPLAWVVGVAAVCTALTAIAHFTHAAEVLSGIRKIARLAHLQESFFLDWNGEPGRDGVDARPSFPARMARVEQRISDHRERNEQTITALQQAVDELHRAQTDQLLVDTARAIITELGHDGELPHRPLPPIEEP